MRRFAWLEKAVVGRRLLRQVLLAEIGGPRPPIAVKGICHWRGSLALGLSGHP